MHRFNPLAAATIAAVLLLGLGLGGAQAADAKKLPLPLANQHTKVATIRACDFTRRVYSQAHRVDARCTSSWTGRCRYVIPWINRASCGAEFTYGVRGWGFYTHCVNRFYWRWAKDKRTVEGFNRHPWLCDDFAVGSRVHAQTSTAMLRFEARAVGDAYTKCQSLNINIEYGIPYQQCEGWKAWCRRKPWTPGMPYNLEHAYCHLYVFAQRPGARIRRDRLVHYYTASGFIRVAKRGTTAWFNPYAA